MRVALVHDYLTQYGGAERVLDVLHEMYPDAPVFTSLYDPTHLPASFRAWDIRESPLRLIPGARRTHRIWTPFYTLLFGHIGFHHLKHFDVVIADSSAWSHHAHPRSGAPLICYCHSPARFLYGDQHYLGASRLPAVIQLLANMVFGWLRWADRRAGRRVTSYIANSEAVRERIRSNYGVRSRVIHPPIDVERFRPTRPIEPEDWYLVVSRLVPHKYIERAIRAATASGARLKVIGTGRSAAQLQAMAGPTVEFLGEQPDDVVVDHMQRCQAFILPGVEDFGMTSPEAQAAGRPVFAMKGGGALETVIDGETGAFFDTVDDLARLMAHPRQWDSEAIQRHAAAFDRSVFMAEMRRAVNDVVAASHSGHRERS